MKVDRDNAAVRQMLAENDRRMAIIRAPFNPITGEGSTFMKDRVKLSIQDMDYDWWVPKQMMKHPLVAALDKYRSVRRLIEEELKLKYDDEAREAVIEELCRVRTRYDFAFWAAFYVYIKPKGGGDDTLFRLNRPQRRLVERLERMRLANKPIRLILLKARQWGGSTCIQLYMAWLQLVHKVGLNSLIVAHQGTASDEIKDMFDKMIDAYPVSMLHALGEEYSEKEKKYVGVGTSGAIHRVPQRNFKIKVGTAERPDSARGGDYNLVHCSEVGLWRKTDGKSPKDIVMGACKGVLYRPYTMIVYESTAKGVGNFFHKEWLAAKEGKSMMEALFIPWFGIDDYSLPLTARERRELAERLWLNRNQTDAASDREEPGSYLYWLWEQGATLEAINWYIHERAGCDDHAMMAAEFPSDDIEAFANSGEPVFEPSQVQKLRRSCKPPKYVGELVGAGDEGADALRDLRFVLNERTGRLSVWEKPEIDPDEKVKNRYLVVVDIGGRGRKADWSVITVFDRLFMMDGEFPAVVAQWYGHIDMDILSWKAAQIAKWYDDALLVIESNTLETHDKERQVDGDHAQYILNQVKEVYDELYARKQSEEDIRQGLPRKYGFHTNSATKPMVIDTLIRTVRRQEYVERDEGALDEYIVYERRPNGSYGAQTGYHDDRLMTRAIGLHICYREMDVPKVVPRRKPGDRMNSRPRTSKSAATVT